NIELKVELESMKRELAEKQELLVSASKALDSLAGRDSGEPQRFREQAQREIDALTDAFNKKIAELEQCLQTAEGEVEKMAAVAEQEKLKNISLERQLQTLSPKDNTDTPTEDLQAALQEKEKIIEQLQNTVKNQEVLIHQRRANQNTDAASADAAPPSELINHSITAAVREEKVVQYDVDLSQLQEEHASQIQKLQAEKDHLIQCIVHTYSKNNPSLDKTGKSIGWKTSLRFPVMGSLDDEELNCQRIFEVQQAVIIKAFQNEFWDFKNSFDSVIKEKDVELQHLANTLKNLQRAKQDVEDNLNRSLREKDSIISQLQLSLEGKTKDMEESAEHHNRLLSDRTQEIQELRKQLSNRQQQLTAAERHSSSAARLLLLRGQLLSSPDMQKKDPDHVLELTHTIQIMQEHLDERDAELLRRNIVLPGEELAQKTEALNKALKRESELKSSKVLTKSEALQQEHDALFKALRAEQQLYSSLVRTVKEQDSAQRLHALQLELTSVQLLREQLEESIRNNKELRDELESEIHRTKLREGDTLSLIGDQTSYMSICVEEEHDDSLSQLSAQELRHKVNKKIGMVLELQECVSNLQTLNNELQNRLTLAESSDDVAHNDGAKSISSNPWKQMLVLERYATDEYLRQDNKETLLRLRRENAKLRGLLKEQKSTECKEKESADASGDSSDGQAETLMAPCHHSTAPPLLAHSDIHIVAAVQLGQTRVLILDSQGQHVSHHNSAPDAVASDATLYRRCTHLQKVLQEKEMLNNNLAELLNMSEKFITSSACHEKDPEVSDLCFKIDMALQQVKASSTRDVKHRSDCQQNALSEQCRPFTRLHGKYGGEDAATHHCHYNTGDHSIKSLRQIAAESLEENEAKKNLLELGDADDVFADKCQRILELQASLQEEKSRREDHLEHRTVPEAKGLPPSVKVELETLHKALTNTLPPITALTQDDKGVQVDLQDLGYETSGKSEQDREECSSTDLEAGLKPGCSASSLPTLLEHEQATFSSTENLDSASSTPYPSSPAFSSAKVSLKSLRVYDKYGVSEDPLQLQGQVRELKVQLENQAKVILQMQSLLRHNSLSSDLDLSTPDPSTVRDRKGRRTEEQSQEGVEKDGENTVMKDKTSHLSTELERERAQNRRVSEQLQQTSSGSTSPSRLDSLVQSQARELSQLRQQIKESRKLGALQRRQLEDFNKAFKELLQANKVDCYMGEVVKEQLDKSLGILDRLEGRLDRGSNCGNTPQVHSNIKNMLAHELQEKNCLIQSLQSQLRAQSPHSHHSSHSDVYHSDRTSSSYSSPTTRDNSVTQNLLGEHLQEIRALRMRLEESIRTNDRLGEQLEKKLAEVEKDSATNIFIGGEEQSQLANEVRLLWGQNQALKEQLSVGSKDKQKENEKLRETVARRTAKLEQSRKECEALRQENRRLQERLEERSQETAQLQETLQYSKEELHRLQSEVKLLKQQLSDSQHLLHSLRLELQVFEKMKTDVPKSHGTKKPVPSGSWDLNELLSEIRHLRLQLEKSIQTNTALREKLEEQLLRGAHRSETININYLLSSPGTQPSPRLVLHINHDDALREEAESGSAHRATTSGPAVFPDEKRRGPAEVDGGSLSSSSGDSASGAPSRLVPGHRIWANSNGRHILGLIEDYSALRKQIWDGRKLSRSLAAQLQECVQMFRQPSSEKTIEEQRLKSLTGSMNTMQHVLEEAGRLLKLVWRVSVPAGSTAGDGSDNQQDELLKNEVARLKSRLSQQERVLSGAVKRLRTTNHLKEGMEKMIIDQLYITHGVLKKARGNLEVVSSGGCTAPPARPSA
uniref:CDK5 regulatory subunit-associated protein 2/Myomegalin coiled coil domain-containing protein n=1 Tax=Tetraodon nigroviridis TaxID=99883 RepID=H3DN36_TETNG